MKLMMGSEESAVLPDCNAWCEPERDIHCILGYGTGVPVDRIVTARSHGRAGRARVLSCEPAVEAPPPMSEEYREMDAWLVRFRFEEERDD